MKNKLILLITVLALSFIPDSRIFAQFSGSIGYSWFFEDNPQRIPTGNSEYVNSVKSDLDFKLFNKELYLNYSGNFNAFNIINDRTFQMHSLGINYAFNTTSQDEENIFSGINYSMKKGTGEYTAYDFGQTSGFINGKFQIDETFFLRPAFSTSYKIFPALNNLIHYENLFSSQLSKFFETRTGLFFEAGIGSMNYSFDKESTISTSGSGSGNRNGKKSSNTTQSFNVVQFRTMIKISQSLFGNTGINVHYLYRKNLKDNKGIFQSANYIYSGDDELWDDPYGYSSNEIGTELTQKIPFDITLKLNAEFSNRHYTNNISDTLNLAQRIDERFGLWGGISKTFEELPIIDNLELSIEYLLIDNKSNSAIFSYKNNMILFGFQVNF
jgi:hypothetical protein